MVVGYLRVSTGKQHPVNQKDEIERLSQTPQIEICKNEKWKEKVFPKG